MTKLSLKVFTIVCLAGLSFAANADDRDRRGGFYSDQNDRWRLGIDRGRRGSEILRRDGRGWQVVPGLATDVGNGWVIGTDRRGGGYGIYRWNGHDWDRVQGGAVRIGGSYQRPWVINNRNERFFWNGHDWDQDRSFNHRGSRNRNVRSFRGLDQHDIRSRDRRDNRDRNRRRDRY